MGGKNGAFSRSRGMLVFVHRWVGLAMAMFLLIEGVTGSILAFEGPIGRWLDPPPARAVDEANAPTLDFATLATIAERLEPAVQVGYFSSIDPDVAVLRVVPRVGPAGGRASVVDFTHIVLDARTGRDLGRLPDRRTGRSLGSRVMPFIKDLHYNLALGVPGTWIFFLVALAWTIDCVASLVLTLPVTVKCFWSRWKHAWMVRLGASTYRVNFDLHRAGGLWFLAVLFVFAWSSVQLEDKAGTYDRIMACIFDYRMPEEAYATWQRHDATPLRLNWFAAQRRGEELMYAQAHKLEFRILAPASLVNFPENGLYNYEVTTDRSFPDPVRETVFFDGDTGEFKVPPGFEPHIGNIVSDWFRALHMANDPVDYTLYRFFVCLFGIVLSTISVTGVVIWWKKHRARAFRR